MNCSEVWFALCLGLTLTCTNLLVQGRWFPMVWRNGRCGVALRASPREDGRVRRRGLQWNSDLARPCRGISASGQAVGRPAVGLPRWQNAAEGGQRCVWLPGPVPGAECGRCPEPASAAGRARGFQPGTSAAIFCFLKKT